jgi:hypothetical protein
MGRIAANKGREFKLRRGDVMAYKTSDKKTYAYVPSGSYQIIGKLMKGKAVKIRKVGTKSPTYYVSKRELESALRMKLDLARMLGGRFPEPNPTHRDWYTKQRDIALKKARGYAKMGHAHMAQAFIDRANSFAPVSQRQVSNVQKILDKSKVKGNPLLMVVGNPMTVGDVLAHKRRTGAPGSYPPGHGAKQRSKLDWLQRVDDAIWEARQHTKDPYFASYADAARESYAMYGVDGLTTQILYMLSNFRARGAKAKAAKKKLEKLAKEGTKYGGNPPRKYHKKKLAEYSRKWNADRKAGHKGAAELWRGAYGAEAESLAWHSAKARSKRKTSKAKARKKKAANKPHRNPMMMVVPNDVEYMMLSYKRALAKKHRRLAEKLKKEILRRDPDAFKKAKAAKANPKWYRIKMHWPRGGSTWHDRYYPTEVQAKSWAKKIADDPMVVKADVYDAKGRKIATAGKAAANQPTKLSKRAQKKLAKLRKIVKEGQYAKVGGYTVDLFSASAILKIYDALSPANRRKFMDMSIPVMADVTWKLVKNPGKAIKIKGKKTRLCKNPGREYHEARTKATGRMKERAQTKQGKAYWRGRKHEAKLSSQGGRHKVKHRLKMAANPGAGLSMDKLMKNPEFKKALKLYRKVHGCDPEKVTRHLLPLGKGKKVKGTVFLVSMGNAPADSYEPNQKKSKKKGKVWVHPYDNPPQKAVTADGRLILTMPGTHRVKDDGSGEAWIHG